MSQEVWMLSLTAASIGFIHTLTGPDHYVPFVVMARARQWSRSRTALITILCGVGHVGSSVVLGLIGVAMGIAVSHLEGVESFRGNLTGWGLIAFGLVYLVWGVRRAVRNRPHSHEHLHPDGIAHTHDHQHHADHAHAHATDGKRSITPWVLFTVFVFGPCEPLIPILMYPAAHESTAGLLIVTLVFGVVTIATMLGVVLLSQAGVQLLPLGRLERFSHAVAGATILLCGVSIQFLGL